MSGRPVVVELVTAYTDGTIATDGTGPPHAELTAHHDLTDAFTMLAADTSLTPRLAAVDHSPDRLVLTAVAGPCPPPDNQSGRERIGRVLTAVGAADAARIRAAVRHGLLGLPPALLSAGRTRSGPPRAEREGAAFTWSHAAPPGDLPVGQVWGFLLDSRGRAVMMVDSRCVASLPGGTPEPGEDPPTTLAREALEEANAEIGPAVLLGHLRVQSPGCRPYAQLRYAAVLLRLGASVVDVDSGERYRRVLIPAAMVNLVAGWGAEGDGQAQAAAAFADVSLDAPIAWIDTDPAG